MKKLLLIATALMCSVPSVFAKTLVSGTNVGVIQNEAIIALQCKDYNGGLNYYFNAVAIKSPVLNYGNLFRVIDQENGGFILQRLSDSKYVGKDGDSQTAVEAAGDAAVFTAAQATPDNWSTKPTHVEGSNMIRFTTNGTFLNSQGFDATPKYATGTGGYSAWQVYTFTDEEVAKLKNVADGNYTASAVPELEGKYLSVHQDPVTEITPGIWYMMYNRGRSSVVSQEGTNFKMREKPEPTSETLASDEAGYLFKFSESNPKEYDGMYNIMSGYGTYFSLGFNTTTMDLYPREIYAQLMPAENNTNVFFMYDRGTAYVADGQERGSNFVGWASVNKGNPAASYPTSTGGNSAYYFYAVDLVDKVVDLTVNIKYDGKTIETHTLSGEPGTEYTVATPAFFNDAPLTGTLPQSSGEVDYELTQLELPFAYTETTENMKWQAVQQHYSYKDNQKYTWTFSESESNTIVGHQPENVVTEGFPDTQLWAFVGNYNDGFKIYNKAAGLDKWLYTDGTNAKIGTGNEKNIWKVYPTNDLSGRPTNTYCCFKTDGTTYINLNVTHAQGTQLTFWSGADQGSSIWFYSPVELTADYIKSLDEVSNIIPDNYVGKYINSTSNLVAEAESALQDAYNFNIAANLRESLTAFLNSPKNELNPNCWYRLRNTAYDNEHLTIGTDDNIYGGEQNFMTNHNSIVQFVPVPDEEGHYYILSQGNYFGHVTKSTTVQHIAADDDETNRGEFVISSPAYAKYAFADVESTSYEEGTACLHHANHGAGYLNDIVGWNTNAAATLWYIVLAENVNVALNSQVDGMNVGFGYFPFPVKAANDGSKLYYVDCGTDNATGNQVVSYAEVQTVPAHTAFMIGNEELTTATLDIDYYGISTFAAAKTPANILNGTLRAKNVEAGDYTFGTIDENNNYGFVKSTEAPAVNGNSAYLPNKELPKEFQTAVALPFNAPGNTTQIAEVNAEGKAANSVYDLQGRKLVAPIKGINIINGKKILVK